MAAVASVLAARLFGLPETYWAAVSTLIVVQSNLGATLTVSVQCLAGTALGAGIGALMATYFGSNVSAFGCRHITTRRALRIAEPRSPARLPEYLDRTAYRHSGITLAIVMLIVRDDAAWVVALHRFVEFSIGIAVGLVLTMLWPERQPYTEHSLPQPER
jgi:uncharacterized membrane protein YgaE (UPF0421/DUF939 family)